MLPLLRLNIVGVRLTLSDTPESVSGPQDFDARSRGLAPDTSFTFRSPLAPLVAFTSSSAHRLHFGKSPRRNPLLRTTASQWARPGSASRRIPEAYKFMRTEFPLKYLTSFCPARLGQLPASSHMHRRASGQPVRLYSEQAHWVALLFRDDLPRQGAALFLIV